MKKNHKILGGFIACLHCCLMALPLLVGVFNVCSVAIHHMTSYETTYTYDQDGNYQESSKEYGLDDYIHLGLQETNKDFNVYTGSLQDNTSWESYVSNNMNDYPFLLSVDFLGIFSNQTNLTEDSLEVYAYINFYLNWLINMSVIVFVPELILIFLDICRRLVYSFSHKIDGGF